jgi:hypothetical protein
VPEHSLLQQSTVEELPGLRTVLNQGSGRGCNSRRLSLNRRMCFCGLCSLQVTAGGSGIQAFRCHRAHLDCSLRPWESGRASGAEPGNQSSNDMALPHPQSREDKYGKEDKPSWERVIGNFFERTINITDDRNGKDDVNPAKNRAFGRTSHHLIPSY